MFLKKFCTTLVVVLAVNSILPIAVLAKVSINEVAWMGNDKSQYGEWVELYNDGTESVSLKDAILYEAGGATQIIKLTKTIDAGGYYLIARSTPSMPDPVSGLADDLGSFGGSGLSNSGENLVLKSADGEILDALDASSGWPAGDSATKQTMQRLGDKWITATGTPRVLNSLLSSAGINLATNNSSPDNQNSDAIVEKEFTDLSSHSNPADLSQKAEEVKIFASAGRNRLAIVDTPIKFQEKLYTSKNEDLNGGNITWSFGDGETATGDITTHSYRFAGDYAVVMNVIKNAENYVARANVRVVQAELTISSSTPNFIKIKNSSDYEANLGGWKIAVPRLSFTIPDDTIILPRHEITLSNETTKLDKDVSEARLVSPSGNIISAITITTALVNTSTSTLLLEATKKLSEARSNLALLSPKAPIKFVKPIVSKNIITANTATSSERKVSIQIIEKPRTILSYIRSFF